MPASRMPTITPLTPGLPIKATASERPSAAAKRGDQHQEHDHPHQEAARAVHRDSRWGSVIGRDTFTIAGVGARPLRSVPAG